MKRRIVLYIMLMLLALFSTKAIVAQELIPPLPVTAQLEEAITEAVREAIEKAGMVEPESSLIIGNITTTGLWAFGTVAITSAEDHGGPSGYLFIAELNKNEWLVTLSTDAAFAEKIQQAPESLIDTYTKSLFAGTASVMAMELGLPWAIGQTWTLTGGPHTDPRPWDSVDFAGGDRFVRASQEGVAFTPCPNYVMVVHPDNWTTTYYHLTDITVANGQPVAQYDRLGTISALSGCGGSATGPHVHFSLRYNNTPINIHNHVLGGWTVLEGAAPYQGCMVKQGNMQCAPTGQIYNEGTTLPDVTPPVIEVWFLHSVPTRLNPQIIFWQAEDLPGPEGTVSGVATEVATLNGSPVQNGEPIDLFWQDLGSYTAIITVTDHAGNQAYETLSFATTATLESLYGTVLRLCTLGEISHQRVCNSLLAKINQAMAHSQQGRYRVVVNLLNAFANEVQAQQGKKISEAGARILLMDANYVKALFAQE